MDLNKVPSDHIVIDAKMEENNNIAKFDTVCSNEIAESTAIYSDVVKRCRDVELNFLGLHIRNKDMELEEIRGKIRVLEGERVKIEEEVKGLRKKKAVLEGAEIIEVVGGEFSLDERNVGVEYDEESKVDQLMIENKVLECEKSIALKGVEEWKRKCKELELRVRELEERLSSLGNGDILTGMKDDTKDVIVNAARNFGGIPTEGTSSTGKHVKRQLAFCYERSCDQKIAPSTPAGARPSSVTVIDIGSDHESDPDVPDQHGLCSQSEGPPSDLPGVAGTETDITSDEENDTGDEESDPLLKNPKRKHDLMVFSSDDELVENEVLPKRRALNIDNSDSEGEDDDDDALTIKSLINRGKSNCKSDDEDNIPISQLKVNSAQGSRRSVRLQEKKSSGQIVTRPKRRLVKCGQKTKSSPDCLTKKYVEDEESEEDDSGSDDSLTNFIVEDEDDEDGEEDSLEDDNHHHPKPEEASDDDLDYSKIMSQFQRSKDPNSEWELLGDMLSAFGKDPELCMRAVCALCRRQTTDEQRCRASLNQNGRGFSKFDAERGTRLGVFLTDGNPNGDLVKTVEELQTYDPEALEVCRTLAYHYAKQLFEIYENDEDPFFPG